MPAGMQIAGAGGADEPDEHGLGIHAGYGETSLVLHLRPDLVDMTQARRTVPEHIAAMTHLGFNGTTAQFGWLSNDFGPDGVIGDPTGATAAAGAVLFDASVRRAVDVLTEIASFTHDGPRPDSRRRPRTDDARSMPAPREQGGGVIQQVPDEAWQLLQDWLPDNDDPERPVMTLATVDESGTPTRGRCCSASTTATASTSTPTRARARSRQLDARPGAALVLRWPEALRQLVVRGVAERADRAETDRAYAVRSPYLQRLAWVNTARGRAAPARRATSRVGRLRDHPPRARPARDAGSASWCARPASRSGPATRTPSAIVASTGLAASGWSRTELPG